MDGVRKLLTQKPRQTALTAGGILLFAMLFFGLIRPMQAGILYDDGIYIMGAIAMAAGKGYMLPWVEGGPVVHKYPPLFPAILSIPALLFQSLPARITAFLVLNMLFSLAALSLVFRLYRKHYGLPPALAAGLLVMVATSFRFLEPATSVMTEPLYLLLTAGLFAMYLRCPEASGNDPGGKGISWPVILLGLLAFHTRTLGILALGAVVLHQLWLGRTRTAALYGACFAGGVLPWLFWSSGQSASPLQMGDFLVRTFQENYVQTLRMDLLYEHDLLPLYGEGFAELVSGLSLTIFPWLEVLRLHDNPFSESLIVFSSLALSALLLVRLARCLLRREVSLIGIYLALYLLALPLWSFHDQYPRFLAVILPFLLPQFVLSARTWLVDEKLRQAALTGFVAMGIATNLLHVAPQIQRNPPILADYHFVFDTIGKRTEPGDVVWTDNTMDSMMLGLWTRRPALDFFVFHPGPLSPQVLPEQLENLFRRKAEVLYQMLSRHRVRYVVINHALLTRNQMNAGRVVPRNDPATRFLMETHGAEFEKIADSPNGFMTVYVTRFSGAGASIPE